MVPRGLCIRRKDRNRKQSRSKYIRVGNPRQSIYLPKAERTPVCICICICICHQSAPHRYYSLVPTLGLDILTTLCSLVCQLASSYHSFGASTDIPASHHHPFARKLPESPRRALTDGSVSALATVGFLQPNRGAEVDLSQVVAPRSFRAAVCQIASSRGYLSIAWGTQITLGRIRRARLTDAVPSALRRRESRPIPAGNTAESAATNHS